MPFGYVSEIRREGRAEGRIEGYLEGMAEVVTTVLEMRGVEVDDEQRRQIMECRDEETTVRRLRLAITVESTEDLLRETSS